MHNIPDFLRVTPEMQEHFAKGGMIKRADGSYSRRGLWDNIRANKGSGKKPTKEMLEQERKIRAKEYEVGGPITFSAGGEKHRVYEKESPTGNGKGVQGHIMVTHPTKDKGQWDTIDLTEKAGAHTVAEGVAATKEWHAENPEYGNGGYTVKRSNARKGKTHVVIGPDGTKKYFGDSKLGQHPNDPARKKAFYARHKHNLAHNPYFRAFARATWKDGGEIPTYASGTSFVNLSEVKISPKQYQELSADELRALHNKVGKPEGNSHSYGTIPKLIKDSIRDINAIKRLKKITQNYNNSDIIVEPTTQYEGTDGHYYPLTPRETEQYNQYESNLPWYKNLWYNIATKDIPEGSRLANYPERNEAYLNNFPYVYQDYQGQDYVNQDYENQDTLQTPVVYKGTTYTTPFIVNPEEDSNIYYTDGSHANPNRPLTNNSTQVDPKWIAKMQQQGFKNGGSYGPFYGRRDAAKMQRMFTPSADSMTPYFDLGGLNELQTATGNSGQGINTTSPAWSPSISPVATTPNITTAGLDKQNQNQFTMDEKQMTVNRTGPSDNTKMQPGVDVTDSLKPSSGSIIDTLNKLSGYSALGKGIEQLQNAGEQALGATNILSRGFANSQQNAILDFNRKQDNPTNYLNKVSNFAGIQYSKNGGTIGQYKEGDELELTPTQMYLLEKKGYKFQILNK